MVSYKPRVGQRKMPVAASRTPDDDGRAAGDEQMSLIYSMLMSVDGYVEDEHGQLRLGRSR
jgi:hypothetical protein